MSELKRPRRYYLQKRISAARLLDWDLCGVWRWKQEQQPGSELPADFPLLEKLSAAGYTTEEDLDGADAAELIWAGLSNRDAATVITAFDALA